MYDDTKVEAFSAFHDLLVTPEVQMNAQEQYEELIRLADSFHARGVIDQEERRSLIEVATVAYARALRAREVGLRSYINVPYRSVVVIGDEMQRNVISGSRIGDQ